MNTNKTIKISVTHETVLNQIKLYLKHQNLDVIDGLYIALGFNTFYEYMEFVLKHDLVSLNELSLMVIQYYGKDYTTDEKALIIKAVSN